ncbi:MAG: helix-turn-helix domain-containing protein [Defluviimonas sp.]|uniref:DUF6456 domain-containing protein n=1 Tax=Albidovulum sp. TaxID=1872424 RepID=UPI002A31B0AD|nr:helix-turn-helix domain-containing protein [Defluviimonas sp.]
MTAASREKVDWPDWLPDRARLYLRHVERGLSLRDIARTEGCHPSTVLRRIRALEIRREDPLVDEALDRLGRLAGTAHPGPGTLADDGAFPRTEMGGCPMTAQFSNPDAPLADAETVEREARRVLRRLCETDAVLATAADLDKAAVLKGTVRTAVLDRAVAQAFALRDWIAVSKPGRVTSYTITPAGRAALKRLLADEPAPGFAEAPAPFAEQHRIWAERPVMEPGSQTPRRLRYNLAESPMAVLARRRDKDGTAFLSPEMVAAGERLREDFELAQMGPRVAQNWDRFLTGGDRGQFNPAAALGGGAPGARDRVAAALRDLGPGLGDMVLRCCCYLEGLEAAEQRLGWSARSGKIVLRIALQRLARHYQEAYGGKAPLIG